MIKEIYTRNLSDKYAAEGKLEHSSDVEAILQQIKMILGTAPGEVLGDEKFGSTLRNLVFKTKFNKTKILDALNKQIREYVTGFPNYEITTDIRFGKLSNGSDYALVDIFIDQELKSSIIVD